MREARGNIFTVECDAVCITTNGYVKANGYAVMGRGCAKAAADAIPILPGFLGQKIHTNGHIVQKIYEQNGVAVVSFPVKPEWREYHVPEDVVLHMRDKCQPGDKIPGWASTAIPELIRKSAEELVTLTDKEGWQTVVLPRPGCGAGELTWSEVKPLLDPILDDRFICMTF